MQINPIPYCEGCTLVLHFCSPLFCVSPIYQRTAQQYHHQYIDRAPSLDLSRNQHTKGHRKAEAHFPYQVIHESSGTIGRDRSTGIHLGHARTGAKDNTRSGGAWRPPTRNLSMADCNSSQKMRITPYNRHRSGPRTRRSRRDKIDLSIYEIPIVDLERGAMIHGSNVPAPAPSMSSISATAPPSSMATSPFISPSTSTPATLASMAYMETMTKNANAQEQPVEDDNFDTISLGSDIDYQY